MIARSIQPCDELWKALPNEARAHLDEFLRGPEVSNVDVAILYSRLPRDQIASVLLCLPQWNVAPKLLRECIRHFWKVDNRVILQAPGFSLERARNLFRQAQFPLPHDMASTFRAWRGTSGRTLEQASQGLCWTLDRDAACWFAVRHEHREPGAPLVVTALIGREQVLYLDQDDSEQEVILDRVGGSKPDTGDETEWRERAAQFIAKRKHAGF